MDLVIDTLIVLATIWAVWIIPFAVGASDTSPLATKSAVFVGSVVIGIIWPFFVAKRIMDA